MAGQWEECLACFLKTASMLLLSSMTPSIHFIVVIKEVWVEG